MAAYSGPRKQEMERECCWHVRASHAPSPHAHTWRPCRGLLQLVFRVLALFLALMFTVGAYLGASGRLTALMEILVTGDFNPDMVLPVFIVVQAQPVLAVRARLRACVSVPLRRAAYCPSSVALASFPPTVTVLWAVEAASRAVCSRLRDHCAVLFRLAGYPPVDVQRLVGAHDPRCPRGRADAAGRGRAVRACMSVRGAAGGGADGPPQLSGECPI